MICFDSNLKDTVIKRNAGENSNENSFVAFDEDLWIFLHLPIDAVWTLKKRKNLINKMASKSILYAYIADEFLG